MTFAEIYPFKSYHVLKIHLLFHLSLLSHVQPSPAQRMISDLLEEVIPVDELKCVLMEFGEAYVATALAQRQLPRSVNGLDLKVY